MTKYDYRIIKARAFPQNTHTNNPVWTAEELMKMARSAQNDENDTLLFATENKDEALEELKKYISDAWITAGMVGYQLDLELVELLEIECEYDEENDEWYEEDYNTYDIAPFGKDKYYANTYDGEKD